METVYTLALFLLMAVAAFWAGTRLAHPRPATPEDPAEPSPGTGTSEASSPESKDDDPSEEIPKDLPALAETLDDTAGRSPSPQTFLDSPAFHDATDAAGKLTVPPDDLLGFLRHGADQVMALASTIARNRDDLEATRLRPILLERLQDTSLLVRTSALHLYEARAVAPQIGDLVHQLDSDWLDSAATEMLEAFLRRRLKAGESLQVASALKDCESWQIDTIRDAVLRLPEDLRKPLLEALKSAETNNNDLHGFLKSFATILPGIKDTLEDGSPLLMPDALLPGVEQIVANLTRPDHVRPTLLTGDHGVGKSALATLAARQLQTDGYLVIRASAADLMSGQCYLGQIEQRVQDLIRHLRREKIVWIAESFHELGTSGRHKHSETSILDMLMPHLHAGAIRVLGEVRPAALDRLAIQVPRIDTAMEIVRLRESSETATLALAADWINRHPGRNGSRPAGNSPALAEALRLCGQFLPSHARPGNLLDLIKHAFAHLSDARPDSGTISLDGHSFLNAIAAISGMPLEMIDDSLLLDLDTLQDRFSERVMGQPEAVTALVERVAMIKSGLTDPTRPLGVFLFAGPTGTGKTEIAKALAEFLFGSEKRMIRLDMSEFKNPSSLDRLTGGPGDGQSLATRIRQQPFSLVLLDEFEKADAQVWDLFLQVFDDGRLTDAHGNTADLRNAIIILTSNLGAVSAQGTPLGFAAEQGPAYRPDAIHKTIEDTFRKEFVNRIDRIICFQPLSRDTMREILTHQVSQVLNRRGLRRRPWLIEWDPTATEFLLEKGFSPTMGARPLQRAVERHFLAPLANAIVRGTLADDEQLLFVYARDGALRWDSSNDAQIVDTNERGVDDTPPAPFSNRHLILHPSGNEEELRFLLQRQKDLAELLELDAFHERKQACLDAMSAPGFWENDARFTTLGLAEYIDRIESDLAATGRFLTRLVDEPARRPSSPERLRSLVARHAERLFLLEAAYPEITADDPVHDALLAIRPLNKGPKSDAFARGLRDMYTAWATHRGMKLEVIPPAHPEIFWLANISGFGSFHILRSEAGSHHWLEGRLGEVAATTVLVTPGNQAPQPVPDQTPRVVRRYQELPTPLVRDKIAHWRTGRLDLVLKGHFDILGS